MSTVDKMVIKGIRSFSPENTRVITFFRPLTLIVGPNGAGKTVSFLCCPLLPWPESTLWNCFLFFFPLSNFFQLLVFYLFLAAIVMIMLVFVKKESFWFGGVSEKGSFNCDWNVWRCSVCWFCAFLAHSSFPYDFLKDIFAVGFMGLVTKSCCYGVLRVFTDNSHNLKCFVFAKTRQSSNVWSMHVRESCHRMQDLVTHSFMTQKCVWPKPQQIFTIFLSLFSAQWCFFFPGLLFNGSQYDLCKQVHSGPMSRKLLLILSQQWLCYFSRSWFLLNGFA